jgi:enamine deaminase RidA (YjgF/YER057c/UK114 family)
MTKLWTTVVLSCGGIAVAAQAGRQVVASDPVLNRPYSSAVTAGGLVYVAGTTARVGAETTVKGDIRSQTKAVLDKHAATLKAAGTSFDQVASVTVYLKNPADFPAMDEVYRTYFPKDPPARTTVMVDLLSEALVEISMTAIPRGGPREVILPAGWTKPTSPYNYAIRSGDTLFLSGLVSRSGRDNSVVQGDMAVQVKTALDNAGEILKAAGMTMADVVSARCYITDTAAFQDMNKVYRTYFPTAPPSRATLVTRLPGAFNYEVTLVAVRGPREAVTTPNADGTPGQASANLSSAIKVGSRLYLSGMLGSTPATKGDIRAQTLETLTRLGRTLQAGGFAWSDVVEGTVWMTDLKGYDAMNAAYREIISKNFPARATVQAGLVGPDGLIEIAMTAVK